MADGVLERVKVRHPLDRKLMAQAVGLVEDQDQRQAALVQDAARVQHVGHEGRRAGAPRRVDHVAHDGREGRRQRAQDDGSRCRPVEHFDLAWRIDENVTTLDIG